jgi:ketosteroid isomerase-like protein
MKQDQSGNAALISKFYKAFQQKDFKTMQLSYADAATFSDPVFTDLDSTQVRNMWEMFCRTGKDLSIEYKDVYVVDDVASATWIATYTFSATGKKVVNVIKAEFIIVDGKIVAHTDYFNFYKWARQAFGITGWLLGWTEMMKSKVRKAALKNLMNFSERNKSIL